jgi:pimeloyl-ACP methyl ester carboxylesterase
MHLAGPLPVLDLRRTFTDPELPWGLANFGPTQQRLLGEQGYLVVDGEFALGRVLFEEFRHYRLLECFEASRVPALVVHGDRDTYVSYDIARAAADRAGCAFHTVAGSDHGFDSREREDEAIEATVGWLVRQHTATP